MPGRRRSFAGLCAALFLTLLSVGGLSGCDSGDLLDLALDPPSRKPIDPNKTGVNNFFVQTEFGSIDDQFQDISQNLKLHFVRVLFTWSDGVQPSPGSAPNYSFYDTVLSKVPPGVDVLVVLAHTPSWITNSSTWINGNPRLTYCKDWVAPTVRRYANHPRIIGWELWNEPDFTVVPSDDALGLTDVKNYHELLTFCAQEVRNADPAKLVVMGATRSIQQNFPNTLNYNKELKNLGVEGLVDVYNVHYYGKNFESVVTSNGVSDFLRSIAKPIWVTESGEQGPNSQLPYVETVWPFLQEKVPSIERFYYYEYASTAPLEQNYGLRTNDPSFPVSDLYVSLRDR